MSEAFDLLDECVVRLETEHGSEPSSRVCALTLLKGRNLLLGSYGLSLDGLAQEAGALLRPFIEVFEKMVYSMKFHPELRRRLKVACPRQVRLESGFRVSSKLSANT